jgi:protein-S-isoprenylcysteine O-methyltransferase Ste14
MRLFPTFGLSVLDGWLLLGAYFLGLTLNVLTFPREKRRKLFLEPHYPKGDWRGMVLLLGRLAAISLVASLIFTPLQIGSLFFYAGLAIYLLGFAVVMRSLVEYRRAEADCPVSQGIYIVSRNPQWIGLVLVFAGTALAVATWLQLGLLAVLVVAYHFQILLEERTCLGLYGKDYQAYMKRVPRYLSF